MADEQQDNRRVGVRFQFEVEVQVNSGWLASYTMAQIEKQARQDAHAALRHMLEKEPNITLVGELGYKFTVAEQSKRT